MQLRWLYEENNKGFLEQIIDTRKMDYEDYKLKLEDLPNEELFADMEVGAKRIIDALYNNEKIVIFGHDDPDGVTATYVLFDFLTSCGFQNHYYYIPNRMTDHHGIQDNFIDYIKEIKANLVITVDNGVSSYEKIDEINALGIDLIVTDHHMFEKENMPKTIAVINPKREDCNYPYKMLAGVGVSLMLVRYLARLLNKEVKNSYYFWTAVGSIADRVPMTGINWILVRHVLDNWNDISGSTFDYLTSVCSPIRNNYDKMNFINYSYRLIANGRDDGGIHHGLRFLIYEGRDKFDNFGIIQTEKKAMEKNIQEIGFYIDKILDGYQGDGLIYYDQENEITYPLIGTCATFIVNKILEPVLILKKKDDLIFCEGRSSDGFSVLDAFKYCEESLIQYGGHVKAAGFTMHPDNLDRFKELYAEYFASQSETIRENQFLQANASLDISEFSYELKKDLDFLLPFGQENPEPMIFVKNYQQGEKNIKLFMESNLRKSLKQHNIYDLMLQVTNNGQLKVIDIRESNESCN